MPELFSKSLLKALIDDFVTHSKLLKSFKFTRSDIACAVFENSDPENAKTRLWERCSTKSPRPLDAADLISIINACRSLLHDQLVQLDQPGPASLIAEFEKRVCRKLNFAGERATIDDFRIDRRQADALSEADFGVPDILSWHDQTFGFAQELRVIQERSVQTLPEVIDQIVRESDDRRRTKLLHVALSIACLNHPGTPGHETAYNLALTAASKANLLLMTKGYRISEDVQHVAIHLHCHLNRARFIPTLDSHTNYFRYAIEGKAMTEKLWREILPFVEESILMAKQYAEMRPTDERAIQMRSAALSMKARFLAVSGRAGALKEADQLQKESLIGLERAALPYGFAYPVLKNIVQSRFKVAIRCCEEAVLACQHAGDDVSAAAFGALRFHLTDLCGRGVTKDTTSRQLAAKSLASTAVRYKCSHIFDAAAVRRLLDEIEPTTPHEGHPRSTT
jgi:hypothetical protein